MEYKRIYLKRGKEESLKRFHPWVFSGAIHHADSGIADYLRVLHDEGKKVLVISHMPLVGILVRELAGNHLSGFMNPADLYILDSNGDGEKLKVIYSTNCYDLNA